METVWIVERNYGSEGWELIGVFASMADATRYADQVEWRAEGIELYEHRVGEGSQWVPGEAREPWRA